MLTENPLVAETTQDVPIVERMTYESAAKVPPWEETVPWSPTTRLAVACDATQAGVPPEPILSTWPATPEVAVIAVGGSPVCACPAKLIAPVLGEIRSMG